MVGDYRIWDCKDRAYISDWMMADELQEVLATFAQEDRENGFHEYARLLIYREDDGIVARGAAGDLALKDFDAIQRTVSA